MTSKNIISIIIITALLGGFGYYVYQDLISTTPVGDGMFESGDGLSNVKITTESVQKTFTSAPDLNRQIVWASQNETAEYKASVIAKINEIVVRLKKNPSVVNDWIELGLYRNSAGDYEGAREVWEYAAAVSPTNLVPVANLGDLYHYYLKNYPKAEENMLKAIKIDPAFVEGYRRLYDLYTLSYTAKASLAPKVLTDGIKANPDAYDLMILLGSYWKEKGDNTKALQYYNQALAVAQKMGDSDNANFIRAEIDKLK